MPPAAQRRFGAVHRRPVARAPSRPQPTAKPDPRHDFCRRGSDPIPGCKRHAGGPCPNPRSPTKPSRNPQKQRASMSRSMTREKTPPEIQAFSCGEGGILTGFAREGLPGESDSKQLGSSRRKPMGSRSPRARRGDLRGTLAPAARRKSLPNRWAAGSNPQSLQPDRAPLIDARQVWFESPPWTLQAAGPPQSDPGFHFSGEGGIRTPKKLGVLGDLSVFLWIAGWMGVVKNVGKVGSRCRV